MPAVQLFVMRAQAADARFELSPANAEAVAELSRRLEGLPLAVELAAARIRLLEPKALLARMHQSLALLRWDAPDLPPRHRSLHATLDWSYALLTAHQQALFRRLVVFAGGFTLEGAEAVFTGDVPGADDGAGDGLFYRHPEPPPRPPAALDDLAALVDHSLVQPVDRGRGGAALPDAGDGAPVRAGATRRRAARKARCGGGTWSTSWRWPSTCPSASGCRRRSESQPGWTPSTTTCERRWRGRRPAGRRGSACGWRGR